MTEFGLSLPVSHNDFGDTLFYNDVAYDNYSKWALTNTKKWRELKQIIKEVNLSEKFETPCIVVNFYKYTLFGLFGPPRHEVKAFIFSKDYQNIFHEIKKKINSLF